MADLRIQLLTGIFKDDTQLTDKYNCLYYAYNTSHTAFVAKKSRFDTLENADSNLTTYNATFLSNLANDFDNVTVNSNSVAFSGTDYKFYKLDVTISSSSADIDYTTILTNINTNLSNLNTNILNKNNQSDIVSCLQDIFMYTASNGNKVSSFKSGILNSNSEGYLQNASFLHQFKKLINLLSGSVNYDFNQDVGEGGKMLLAISRKLALTYNNAAEDTILGALTLLRNSFVSDTSNTVSNARLNSYLKQISDKLANANDLHTISQAIDLISTAIAQTNNTLTNTNTDLGNIATNINSIQSNPLIEVNIDVPYEVKNLTKKDTEY